MKVSTAAISPVKEADPNLLVQNNTKINDAKVNMSHRNGMRVTWKNVGANKVFRTNHNAEDTDIAAISLLLKRLMR